MLSTLGVTSTSTLTAIGVANLMGLTLLVSTAKEDTVTAETLLANSAMFVKGALRFAATIDTNVLIRTVDWRKAHSHKAIATQLRITAKSRRTGTYWLMSDHCALSVGSTGSRCVAHVLAAVENAGLLVGTLVVTATTNLAALLVADFSS